MVVTNQKIFLKCIIFWMTFVYDGKEPWSFKCILEGENLLKFGKIRKTLNIWIEESSLVVDNSSVKACCKVIQLF